MNLSSRILSRYNSRPVSGLTEALTVILTSIGEHAMAGTDHIPDPGHSTVEKCSVNACFMAACTVPLISRLNESGNEVDVDSLMRRVGRRVFRSYCEEDRQVIMDSGILMFKEMLNAAQGNHRLEEWMGSVHNVTQRYVLTEGYTDCADLFAPLYLVLLMATRQIGTRH